MFCYNIEKERTLNIVFDEHFRISDVHGMDEKVYGGQTMSKRKLLTVILLAFVTTLMLACAIIFTACGNNETPDDGHNTEQGGENPSDGKNREQTPAPIRMTIRISLSRRFRLITPLYRWKSGKVIHLS